MSIEEVTKSIGLGLSRVLRYTFPGFLFVAFLAFINPSAAEGLQKNIGWELLIIFVAATGTGLYAVHRSLIIPIHHFLGCFIMWCGETLTSTSETDSLSPTRWLASQEVPRYRRMIAYRRLRHSFFDAEEANELNVLHAEQGLVVMVSEAFVALAIYRWDFHIRFAPPDWPLLLGIFLFVFSAMSSMQNHRLECAQFKSDLPKVGKEIAGFKMVKSADGTT